MLFSSKLKEKLIIYKSLNNNLKSSSDSKSSFNSSIYGSIISSKSNLFDFTIFV